MSSGTYLAPKFSCEGHNDEPVGHPTVIERISWYTWWKDILDVSHKRESMEVALGPCKTPGCGHGVGLHDGLEKPCRYEDCSCRVFRVRMGEMRADIRKVLEGLCLSSS